MSENIRKLYTSSCLPWGQVQSISRNGLAGISWNQTATFRSTLGMCSISSHFPVSTLQRELDNTTSVDIKQHLQSLPSWRFTVENTGIYWHWGQCGSQLGFFGKSKLHQTKSSATYHNQANLIQLVLPLCLDCLDLRRLQASLGAWASCLGMPSLMSYSSNILLVPHIASLKNIDSYWIVESVWMDMNGLTVDWVRPTLSLQHAVELVAALVLRMIQRNGPGTDNRPTLRTMRE